MEKSDFLLIILFIILAISLVVLMGKTDTGNKTGIINLGQSRSEILSRCLEKGYQDFKITENKIYCVQKGEILILN